MVRILITLRISIDFLIKKKAAYKIKNISELKKISLKLLKGKKKKKINFSNMGNLILKKSEAEILKIFKDEIKKT